MGTVAFTGYRPEKLPFVEGDSVEYIRFRKTLFSVIRRLCELGYGEFISGVAMGFDTWVAEDVITLKSEFPSIQLHCAVPFPDQADKWSKADKLRRERIIENADSVTVTSTEYSKSCFFTRNRYMVDRSDVVVCCFDGLKGGTAYTVDYARKRGLAIVQINPTDNVVSIVGGKKP